MIPAEPDDADLTLLKEKLFAQRAERKASLEKHKATTFKAVESVKGTICYDPAKLREKLAEVEEALEEGLGDLLLED